jgi:hypothetical protein
VYALVSERESGRPEELSDEFQDLRNHGESPHNAQHDYTAMSQDVAAFIREMNMKQPTVIGHSMFGLFAPKKTTNT